MVTRITLPPYESTFGRVDKSADVRWVDRVLDRTELSTVRVSGRYLASESTANWRRHAGSTRQSRPTRIANPKTHT